MSLSFNSIQNGMNVLVGKRIAATPLSMEISGVFRHFRQRKVHLIVEDDRLGAAVFDRDLGAAAEGHSPIAVHAACGIYCNGIRVDIAALAPAVAEEVAERNFYGRRLLSIPIDYPISNPLKVYILANSSYISDVYCIIGLNYIELF